MGENPRSCSEVCVCLLVVSCQQEQHKQESSVVLLFEQLLLLFMLASVFVCVCGLVDGLFCGCCCCCVDGCVLLENSV